MSDTRVDGLLGGRVRLRQPARGHRAGTDAVLLAACAPEGFAGLAVDWGAGVGSVGLAVARQNPGCTVRLVEIDPPTAAMARENAGLNGLSDRVGVIEADILAPPGQRRAAGLSGGDADLLLTNPPFLDRSRDRVAPDPGRALAHVMPEGGLEAWLAGARAALKPGGRLALIHRADALGPVLAAMRGFGAVAVLPVHPAGDRPAVRILVGAVLGSRAPLSILPGLVLHGPDGRFTPQAEALHRGEARLGLFR
jgi:tRNA1(Val) A37 N6-methylase TrmN6